MKTIILIILFCTQVFSQTKLLLFDDISYETETLAYKTRVEADGGEIGDLSVVNAFYKNAKENDYLDSLSFAYLYEGGKKAHTTGNISTWYDLTSNNRDATSADTTKYPFDISALVFKTDALKPSNFTANQPLSYFAVFRNDAITAGNYIWDGGTTNSVFCYQDGTGARMTIRAGTALTLLNMFTTGFGLLHAVYNGATSSGQANDLTAASGNAGAANAGGLTIGNRQDGAQATQVSYKAFLGRNGLFSTTKTTAIKNFLNTTYILY